MKIWISNSKSIVSNWRNGLKWTCKAWRLGIYVFQNSVCEWLINLREGDRFTKEGEQGREGKRKKWRMKEWEGFYRRGKPFVLGFGVKMLEHRITHFKRMAAEAMAVLEMCRSNWPVMTSGWPARGIFIIFKKFRGKNVILKNIFCKNVIS